MDHKIMQIPLHVSPKFPSALHGDVSGTVEEVGAGVAGFPVGSPVYGFAGGVVGTDGASAEFMRVNADLVSAPPESISLERAAAVPLAGITAWYAIENYARPRSGQRILFFGGTGGVGHLAMQLAKLRGAHVTTTVSNERKAELARSFGADEVVFYKRETTEAFVQRLTNGAGFDIVIDGSGGRLDDAFKAAALHGRVIGLVGRGTHDLTPMHVKGLSLDIVNITPPLLTGVGCEEHLNIMRELTKLIDAGKLRILIHDNVFKMQELNEAHALYEEGAFEGKIVISASR